MIRALQIVAVLALLALVLRNLPGDQAVRALRPLVTRTHEMYLDARGLPDAIAETAARPPSRPTMR